MKRKIVSLILVLILCIATPLAIAAETVTEQPEKTEPAAASDVVTFTVTGTGECTLEPNVAILSLGVTTYHEILLEALTTNATTVKNVIDTLKENGIAESDIQTDYFSLYPQYDYNAQFPQLTGFSVSHNLSIKQRDIEKAGELIDAAVTAGVTDINNLTYTSLDARDAYDQALELALADAAHKAKIIATSLNLTGSLTIKSVVEEHMDFYPVNDPTSMP